VSTLDAGQGGAPVIGPADCGVCAIHRDPHRVTARECHRGDRWIVRHHPDPAPLAGWSFLCTVRHVQGPADLDDAEAAGFGPALRAASRAVRAATGCDRVYAIAFGQGAPHLHVHLVPRVDAEAETAAWRVADWYRAVERGERPAAAAAEVDDVVARLRAHLREHPPE
jgi:diadenosine tetraphosphate (Ap4A) HIT family hydrolase